MTMTTWPLPAHTDLTVQVTTDGLAGVYDATVRLGRAEVFRAGWQPMLDPVTLRQLLADLTALGDEPTQLAALGWTLRATAPGQVELIDTNLPTELLDQIDGRFVLPRECGFTVAGDLPPLAQLYRSLTLLEAHAYGPTDQLVEPGELLAQASTATHALGQMFGALLGLAVDTDADTVREVLTLRPARIDGDPAPPAGDATCAIDAIASVRALHQQVLSAATQMVTAYLPTAPVRPDPHRPVSAAETAFAALTADQRTRLLRCVFEVLEYDGDGRPGSGWSSDTTQALGERFDQFGIAFTSPDHTDFEAGPDQEPAREVTQMDASYAGVQIEVRVHYTLNGSVEIDVAAGDGVDRDAFAVGIDLSQIDRLVDGSAQHHAQVQVYPSMPVGLVVYTVTGHFDVTAPDTGHAATEARSYLFPDLSALTGVREDADKFRLDVRTEVGVDG